ncbi:hypothetical protein FHS20_004402 [Phyllobacterium endophyticum]|uniref:Uncharacterized protein n=1 Tax=Phyllobacterium endophyticum TaxID=1149773 RepID=A0A2P7ARN2_9HYPH|nr:hypothetical protein [Phyllobacterium endophyticum]PSH56823.1 hypothetical protein CU100_15960 [Phyllobacterium endophyticum]
MNRKELLSRLKIRRSVAIAGMLKSGENDKSLRALSEIQGSIAAIEVYLTENMELTKSPSEDPNFTLNR